MANIKTSQIQAISTLPRKYKKYIEDSKKSGPIIFMSRSEPVVVLMDFKQWETINNTNNENLSQSKKDYLTTLESIPTWSVRDTADYKQVKGELEKRVNDF